MAHPIAVIGMAGRFPKARNLREFWRLLHDKVEVIERIPEEMIDSRRDRQGNLPPEFVPMGVYLEDTEYFDCGLFGVSRRDAMIMDPQQRIFIEQAWAAAEDAGYDITKLGEHVAVYAGAGPSRHPLDVMVVFGHDSSTMFEIIATGIDKPMAMRTSHLFDLRGESLYVYAACATSLVAINMAFNALQEGRADAAIAGASVLYLPQLEGYDYAEGGVRSSDGHCRAFDVRADGTVWGSGVGVVVLKRLDKALRDRDHIHALLIGSAVNNDGIAKNSFAAPSRDGQAEVVRLAIKNAGINPEDIDFVEAHGTGTPIGDPIEVEALNAVFGKANGTGTCTLGSVKTNIGHLDPAAGIAGLIKVIQSLENEIIPATLHFEEPNPAIDFEAGPFAVNVDNKPWMQTADRSRRASVSSFGVGGTNAHVIVEEAPPQAKREVQGRRFYPVTLSARSPETLQKMCRELSAHLRENPDLELRDIAFTRNCGRRRFSFAGAFVAATIEELSDKLAQSDLTGAKPNRKTKVGFVFPGQGSQCVDMLAEIYAAEPDFRTDFDECAEILTPLLGHDIRHLIFPTIGEEAEAEKLLRRTDIQQPLLFSAAFALARFYKNMGCEPSLMIGHSIGEYVCAALAGTLKPASALKLLVARGAAMQKSMPGKMLAVLMPLEDLEDRIPPDFSIAAVNSPVNFVVSGETEAIADFERLLENEGVRSVQLQTSHAFHSSLMDDAVERFRVAFDEIALSAPEKLWISNLTGELITAEQAVSRDYWLKHLRSTVRFAQGIRTALENGINFFLELGGSPTLGGPIQQTIAEEGYEEITVMSATKRPSPDQLAPDTEYAKALAAIWEHGLEIDWECFHRDDEARRVSLPHYPFEGIWVALPQQEKLAETANAAEPVEISSPVQTQVNQLPTFQANTLEAIRTPRPVDYQTPYVEPSSESEIETVEIFSRVLGIAPVGSKDNFFELGGNSIMLVHVVNQVRAVFEVNVPIRDIISNSTPEKLAAFIDNL